MQELLKYKRMWWLVTVTRFKLSWWALLKGLTDELSSCGPENSWGGPPGAAAKRERGLQRSAEEFIIYGRESKCIGGMGRAKGRAPKNSKWCHNIISLCFPARWERWQTSSQERTLGTLPFCLLFPKFEIARWLDGERTKILASALPHCEVLSQG